MRWQRLMGVPGRKRAVRVGLRQGGLGETWRSCGGLGKVVRRVTLIPW